MKPYREKVKMALREALEKAGFKPMGDHAYVKVAGDHRKGVTYTLYRTHFEVFEREYPMKEGYYTGKYRYLWKWVKNLPVKV